MRRQLRESKELLSGYKGEADNAKELRRKLEETEALLTGYRAHCKELRVLWGQRTVVRGSGPVCPREVKEALARIAAEEPAMGALLSKERQVIEVDREATTEEESED